MPPTRRRYARSALATAAAAAPTAAAQPENTPLAAYFGFDDNRIIVVDDNAGPFVTADFNNDGRTDIAIANDAKSRIELHLQRQTPRTPEQRERELRVNEIPPAPWFDRVDVPVAHAILALHARDLDADGDTDILYAGRPAEIVALHQQPDASFEIAGRRRVRDLRATQSSFAVADVTGDNAPELVTLVEGKPTVYTLTDTGPVGEPTTLPSDGDIVALFLEDYDGNNLTDILGVLIESDTPLRLWRQRNLNAGRSAPKRGLIGPEVRFETPTLIEVEPFRTPGRDAASIAVIERQSRRMVLYDLATENIEPPRQTEFGVAEREAVVEIHAFRAGEDRSRAVAIDDIDRDGLPDLVATDQQANAIALRLQQPAIGLADAQPFSAFKEPAAVAAGQWDDDTPLEIFVLSEEENAVGVAHLDQQTQRLSFPNPINTLTPGATPVAMNTVTLPNGAAALAIVMRDRRDHVLEVHYPNNAARDPVTLELDDVNRPPGSLLAGDFDRDDKPDLILFTPGEPLVMIADVTADAPAILYDDDMANFGLVNAAGPQNTATFDINNDGDEELLIADENFIRAASFDTASGWTVTDQITVPDPAARLAAITTLDTPRGTAIVAADTTNDLILVIEQREDRVWAVRDKLRLTGIDVNALHAGAFDGRDSSAILAVSPDAFAIIKLAGQRVSLDEFASFRSDDEQRREHEIEAGDINADGFTDLVVVDDNDKTLRIFTLSRSRKLLDATAFKVFEQRLFSQQSRGGREPSAIAIDDVTADGLDDIIVEVHDRYIIYPQQAPNPSR